MPWREATVVARSLATPDIAVIDLVPAAGEQLPAYPAGAHIDVLLGSGLVRQYSLCGPPVPDRYRLAVLRTPASRGGSRAMHTLDVGDTVRISVPRNHFPLAEARRHLLFAGGIGITPLLAMARHLERAGGDFTLHYCTRSRSHTAFLDELTGNPRVRFHFDDGDPGQLLDAAVELGQPDSATAIYVCGPDGFMDYVQGKAAALGWPAEAVHTERFGTGAGGGQLGERPPAARDGFTVRLASTGAEFHVPETGSVLDVLLDNGIDAPYSCRQGICGECVVRVLAGEPDHRDDVLTDAERSDGLFTTCSSRSHSAELELDL
ncbi:PDR/VanB family oxidoreductase [Nocardia higoensis]|uniref:PDR/VanB family oxidoreductase n=1 Tax=Nocardia higoensis TaxID=228599 RepID=UPI000593A0CA|nr:PDR/VanB family oxidoreductase [Nocardia higoensis]